MNRHLNNWLDQAEGLPENTTNMGISKELARQGYPTEKDDTCLFCDTGERHEH